MAEWLNAAVSKTVWPATRVTGVRIPPPPPGYKLQARETVPVLFLQARSDERAFLVRDVLTLRAPLAAKLAFNRRSRTEVRFASLSSHLRSPAQHSLSLVRMDH